MVGLLLSEVVTLVVAHRPHGQVAYSLVGSALEMGSVVEYPLPGTWACVPALVRSTFLKDHGHECLRSVACAAWCWTCAGGHTHGAFLSVRDVDYLEPAPGVVVLGGWDKPGARC